MAIHRVITGDGLKIPAGMRLFSLYGTLETSLNAPLFFK
jgi:hypothetical protein